MRACNAGFAPQRLPDISHHAKEVQHKKYVLYRKKKFKFVKYGAKASKGGELSQLCFKTSGAVPIRKRALEVTGILLDSGAASNFIRRDLAEAADLAFRRCKPQAFEVADGSTVYSYHYVRMTLYMAGVGVEIAAYVDDSNNSDSMILGMPDWKAFGISATFTCGPRKNGMKVTVRHDVTGHRRYRYVVEPDQRRAEWKLWKQRMGVPKAMRPGETASEKKRREVCERAKVRYERLLDRYG